jgi:hypothetical protein
MPVPERAAAAEFRLTVRAAPVTLVARIEFGNWPGRG